MEEQVLAKLLRRYAGMCRSNRIYVKPDIPWIKAVDAMAQIAHEVTDERTVLMVYDDTFFRNCSIGIVVSTDAFYVRGKGSGRFRKDFLNDIRLEINRDSLYIDGVHAMSFKYIKRLEQENIRSFAMDIQALFLGRPVPSLDRGRPPDLLAAAKAVDAAVPDDIFGLEGPKEDPRP
ncbi:MAG: hypothetical protein LBR80_10055 [Deltaproteobacteria bacterium]|jgi:hypothetical protein|nr:hypothetical protein [Deltaproteobacteria bacterium]